MNYIFKKQHLEIKLSWKERFRFFFTGKILFDRKSAYINSTALLALVSHSMKEYGDGSEHGEIKPERIE
jgi:hypothetical protein